MARKVSDDGLPVDGREWTEADWRDLHEAMESVKRKFKARHAERCEADGRTTEPATARPRSRAAR